MSARRRIIRRKPVEEELEEEELEETESELEEEEELEEDEIEEEEEEEVVPVRKARKMDEAPAPATKKVVGKPAPVAKKAPAPAEESEDEEEYEEEEVSAPKVGKVKVRKVETVVADNVFAQILEGIETGKSVLITRTGDGKWELSLTDGKGKSSAGRLTGKAYWDEVSNPEFTQWNAEWQEKTFDEKKSYAKKLGLKWEEHANPKVEVMRITEAVRNHLGVEKYKEEYRTRSARAAIKG